MKFNSQNTMEYILKIIPEYQEFYEDYSKYWEYERPKEADLEHLLKFAEFSKNNKELSNRIDQVIETLDIDVDGIIAFATNMNIESILKIIPEYKELWQDHVDYWNSKMGSRFGNDIMDFLDFTTELIRSGQNQKLLIKVFVLIEELITNGDEFVLEKIEMNFFDDLLFGLSGNEDNKIPYSSYIHLLGPEAKKICRRWHKHYNVDIPELYED